jgi:O-antigen ligase
MVPALPAEGSEHAARPPGRSVGARLREVRPVDAVLAVGLVGLPLAPYLNLSSPLGTGLRLALAAALAVLVVTGRIPLRRPLLAYGRWLIVAFALFQLIPVLVASNTGYGAVRAINWLMFVPLAFVAYDRRAQRVALASGCVAAALLLAGVVLQSLGLVSGIWPGFPLEDGSRVSRYSSFLLNPNDLGLFVLGTAIALAAVTGDKGGRRGLAGVAVCTFAGLIVILTGSRGALVAVAAALLFLLVAGFPKRRLAAASAAVAVGLVLIPLGLPELREASRVILASGLEIATGDDRSATVRENRWSRLLGGSGARLAPRRTNLADWVWLWGTTAGVTTEQRHSGARASMLARRDDYSGSSRLGVQKSVGGVEPGGRYTLVGHCRAVAEPATCRLAFVWLDRRRGAIEVEAGAPVRTTAERWTRAEVSAVAPRGATGAYARATIDDAPEGSRHLLDSFSVAEGPGPLLSFPEDRGGPLGLVPRAGGVPALSTEPPPPPHLSPARNELTPASVVFGSGYGGYATEDRLRGYAVDRPNQRRRALVRTTVDNGWLKLFLEEGLVGLGLFVAVYAAALWRSFSARRTALGLATGALLVALGSRALSADVLDINPWNFVLWLLVGLALGTADRRSGLGSPRAPAEP